MDEQALLRHRGLGIASFAVAMVVLLLIFLVFGVAGVLKVSGIKNPAIDVIIGLGIIVLWLANLVGIGLGIEGVVDKTSKKIFPILGLVIGAGTLAISVGAVVIGIRMA